MRNAVVVLVLSLISAMTHLSAGASTGVGPQQVPTSSDIASWSTLLVPNSLHPILSRSLGTESDRSDHAVPPHAVQFPHMSPAYELTLPTASGILHNVGRQRALARAAANQTEGAQATASVTGGVSVVSSSANVSVSATNTTGGIKLMLAG